MFSQSLLNIIAYFGGTILGLQMIPQIIKVYKTKSSTDLSYAFLSLNIIGLLCMATYGISNGYKPIYIPILFSITNTICLLYLKIYYESKFFKDQRNPIPNQQMILDEA